MRLRSFYLPVKFTSLRVVCEVDTLSWEPLGINGVETVKLSFKLLKLHESSTFVGDTIFQRLSDDVFILCSISVLRALL